jgi:hypothetical protein
VLEEARESGAKNAVLQIDSKGGGRVVEKLNALEEWRNKVTQVFQVAIVDLG